MSSDPEFDTAELVVAKMALELLRSERDRLAVRNAELFEALETAKNGLLWYADTHPNEQNGSDAEAMAQINNALAGAKP